MNLHRKLSALLIALISVSSTFAAEDEISVLAVHTANASTASIASQMLNVSSTWLSTGPMGLPIPNTINLLNAGLSVPLGGSELSGDAEARRLEAISRLSSTNIRDQWGADIVIVFTDSLGAGTCGLGRNYIWTNLGGTPSTFIPNTDLVDMRPSESYYVGMVSTDAACNLFNVSGKHVSAHEFGHLLGGGHERAGLLDPATDGLYFNSNSHAGRRVVSNRFGNQSVFVSALATVTPDFAECNPGWPGGALTCTHSLRYSTSSFSGTSANNNQQALNITARSEANYRTAVPCGLSKPQNVGGWVTNTCYNGFTLHRIVWADACPEQTDFYEIQTSIVSSFGPYLPSSPTWITFTNYADAESIGGTTWGKVKACDGSGCTGLSSTYYTAPYLCTQ